MASVRLVMNKKGFAELRNSEEVLMDLNRRAERIERAAGPGFEATPAYAGTRGSRPRGRASVGTTDRQSRREQSKDNILQRAMNAGR